MPINSFLYPGAKTTPAYEVANSVRFNDGSGDELTRSQGSSPSSRRLFTFSAWVKRSSLNSGGSDPNMQFFSQHNDTSDRMDFRFQSGDTIDFRNNSPRCRITTDRLFRDVSSWYHICLRVDTTQSTAANRIRLYINGVQETSFSTADYGDQNDDLITNASTFDVGDDSYGTAHFDGYMCEVVYCDGQSLAPTSFGEFDEDSPTIWKPIDVSGLTFGTNGFYLQFKQSGTSANSSGIGADTSGNDHHFTVNNLTAADQATDTCTNNFCTLNPLYNIEGSYTLSEGNTIFTATGANDGTLGTIAVSSGKWYFEAEFDSVKEACYAGFADVELINNIGTGNPITSFIGQYRDDYAIQIGGSNDGAYTDVANGDIFGFAINLDANSGSKTVVIQKNGTTTDTVTIPTANENNFFIPVVGDTTGGDPSGILKCNFGGSPAVAPSSAVADANGFGSFEYNPTIGGVDYLAICTKNLAEYG